jgi:osmoprotectant transport system permease protein
MSGRDPAADPTARRGASVLRQTAGVFTFLLPLLLVPLLWETPREFLLGLLMPGESELIYRRISLIDMVLRHLLLVGVSTLAATLSGIGLGILVTRPVGRDFLGIVRDMASLAQTFPPVAVLALAVPSLGYGFEPTVVALFLYSLLPVLNNTIEGMESIPKDLTEASRGIGMTRTQVLFLSELPLAARLISAGIRTSVVINIGTATVGAVVGAGGLGVIIIAGLVRNNTAFVLTGAAAAAALALAADRLLGRIEGLFYAPRSRGG